MRAFGGWLALFLTLATPAARAAVIADADVKQNGDHYRVTFDVRVDAPLSKVRALLTDFAHLDRLSDTIIDDRVLDAGPGGTRLRLAFRACVLVVFCRTILKTSDVRTDDRGDILFTIVPAESDFGAGSETWHFEGDGAATQLQYRADFAPTFFVPPVIGPWLMKRRIVNELETTVVRIETLAHESAHR
jgi:Polyketide cyclase / dehydrase and lipid transport